MKGKSAFFDALMLSRVSPSSDFLACTLNDGQKTLRRLKKKKKRKEKKRSRGEKEREREKEAVTEDGVVGGGGGVQ